MVCRGAEAGEESRKSILCDRLPGLLGNHFEVRLSFGPMPARVSQILTKRLNNNRSFQCRVAAYDLDPGQ